MKRFVTVIITIALAVILIADNEEPESKAQIELRETVFDFGIAPAGMRYGHHFLIRSIGEEPLLIENVRATCGCTSAPLEKDSLAPGDSTFLKVIFNSSGYNGRSTRKQVRISTNDMHRPLRTVTFATNCDTTEYIFIKPEPLFLSVGGGDNFRKETSFSVENVHEDETLDIALISFDFEAIESVDIENTTLKPGEKTVVKIVMLEPEENTRIQSSVTLEAFGQGDSRITIPIFGGLTAPRRHPSRD